MLLVCAVLWIGFRGWVFVLVTGTLARSAEDEGKILAKTKNGALGRSPRPAPLWRKAGIEDHRLRSSATRAARKPSSKRQTSSIAGCSGSIIAKHAASTRSRSSTWRKLSKSSSASSARLRRRETGDARVNSSTSALTRCSASGPPRAIP